MRLKSICGVIIPSNDPGRLARFYGRVLGCEFQREDHGDLAEHFGVDVGEIHFGIHPPVNFRRIEPGEPRPRSRSTSLLSEAMAVLDDLGAQQVQPPHDEGFGLVTSYLDPDGNLFELVELSYEFGQSAE